MTAPKLQEVPGTRRIEHRPGETRAEFIARIVASSGRPSVDLVEDLRNVLRPVTPPAVRRAAA